MRISDWSSDVFSSDLNPCQLGETECTFAIQGITRPIRTPARVDQFDKPRAFAWSCGIPYLFTLEEQYELAGDDGGTRLTHSCTLRGALSLPFAAMLLRRLRSEERRVGQEGGSTGRSRGSPYHVKK